MTCNLSGLHNQLFFNSNYCRWKPSAFINNMQNIKNFSWLHVTVYNSLWTKIPYRPFHGSCGTSLFQGKLNKCNEILQTSTVSLTSFNNFGEVYHIKSSTPVILNRRISFYGRSEDQFCSLHSLLKVWTFRKYTV